MVLLAKLIAGLCALLSIVLGIRVAALGRAHFRRLLLGGCFAAGGALILLGLAAPEREVEGGRRLLVVHSPSLSTDERGKVLQELQHLPSGRHLRVAFVALEREQPGAAAERGSDRLRFQPPRDLETAAEGHEGLRPEDSLGSVLDRLVGRVETSGGFREGGILFLHDEDSLWGRLRPPAGETDLKRILARLDQARVRVYVRELPARRTAGLDVFLEREQVPSGRAKELDDIVRVEVPDIDEGGSFPVCVFLDDVRPGEYCPHLLNLKLKPKPEPHLTFSLSELSVERLQPGFHQLNVEVRAQGGRSVQTGSHYFRVADPGLVVLYPPVPQGVDAAGLLRQADQAVRSGDPSRWFRIEAFHPPPNEKITFGRLTADGLESAEETRVEKALVSSRALVLVEPTAVQLTALEARFGLAAKIREGLDVLVLRPPAQPAKDAPAWMPAWAAKPPGGGDDGMSAMRDLRVYLLVDSSRWTQLPAPADPNRTPAALELQRAALSRVYQLLGAPARAREVKVVDDLLNGPIEPVEGSLEGRKVILYPMLTPRADLNRLEQRWDTEGRWQRDGPVVDFAPGDVGLRLASLFAPPDKAPKAGSGFQPLRRDGFYPNTAVLVFAPDLQVGMPPPDIDVRWRLTLGGKAQAPGFLSAPGTATLLPRELAAQGIFTLLAQLPLDSEYDKFYRQSLAPGPVGSLDGLRQKSTRADGSPIASILPSPLRPPKLPEPRVVKLETAADVNRVVDALVQWLKSRSPGKLALLEGGRAVDQRLVGKPVAPGETPKQATRTAPRRHAILEPARSLLERPHAVIADDRKTDVAHKALPAVVSSRIGTGVVVVTAYSPFDPDLRDLWQQDDGRESPDGWGLQRIVDLVELTAASARAAGTRPVLREVREMEDGATVLLDVWLPDLDQAARHPPRLAGKPLQWLPSADPHRRTLQLQAEKNLQGFFRLELAPSGAAGATECQPQVTPPLGEECIFLSLHPSSLAGRTSLEALRSVAAFSGGANLPAEERTADLLASRRTWGGVAGLALAVVAVLLFSPAARPWTGARLALVRRRLRRARAIEGPGEAARFDVDGVLSDWGQHPGDPSSVRQAGTPAARKVWEQGDDLAAAEPASLVPFTLLGRRLGLPPTRPRIRRRHVARSMEAILWLDASRSLGVPDVSPWATKAAVARVAAGMLARAVWRQAGSVRAGIAGRPSALWGPRLSEDDAGDLEQLLERGLAPAPSPAGVEEVLPLPRDLTPGHTVFLISDLVAPTVEELLAFLQGCAENDARVRVVHLHDPFESDLVGLSVDVTSGLLLDRTDWHPAELAAAHRQRREELRSLVERSDGHFVSIFTSDTGVELAQKLLAPGFLR